jgi:hypothetical protein
MSAEHAAPEYVLARRALIDVLELLEPQRDGLVLVGAQAVYLRAPAERTQQATYTTDGDLAIDPDLLSDNPDIGKVLIDAGYERGPNPGSFVAPNGVEIDLMVPEGAVAASTRRSAPLTGQSHFTARRTPGLELALLDADVLPIAALDDADLRSIDLRVAGPAALAVAKLIKLNERLSGPRTDRIISKDASDLLRLFRYCDARTIGQRLAALASVDAVADVTHRAVEFLRADTSRPQGRIAALAIEDRSPAETERQVQAAVHEFSRRLLSAFDEGTGVE